MIAYLSFLRGINVSGQKLIKMADLKVLYEKLGLADVITYIQSGNVIFRSETYSSELERNIEQAIQKQYGFDVPVQVISLEELTMIANQNPFLPADDISSLYVTLLEELPNQDLLQRIEDDPSNDDEFQVIGRAVYLHCPKGYGRTKLNNTFFESKLKQKATTRNWKTVLKVIELTQQIK